MTWYAGAMRAKLVLSLLAVASLGACGSDDSTSSHAGSGGSHSGGTGGSGGADAGATGGAGGTAPCSSAAIHVAPNGQGDECSCAAPCALTAGRDHARALAPSMTNDG